ncbi:MAG: DUF177 domain-containing protein [Desulfovibrio sp.]|nr:DUF177 domain-containing protein [Desulfovibrio sp.]
MQKYRISLLDLPPEGREFSLDDQAIWQDPLQEFHMDCRILSPLATQVHVLPTESGCLIRGRLQGRVALPCNRCSEEAQTDINARFEDFEELNCQDADLPMTQPGQDAETMPGAERIIYEGTSPMLDLAAVCWEEFMLALPVNPLCRPDCRGLCPQCGTNRNNGDCTCSADEGDPRLAVLRNLKIRRQ